MGMDMKKKASERMYDPSKDLCMLFPTSMDVKDLVPIFRYKVQSLLDALTKDGWTYEISATTRPPQRAYLMHYAWMIARGKMPATEVPRYSDQSYDMEDDMPPTRMVSVRWNLGSPSLNVQAAEAMVSAYGLVYCPALHSRHTQGRAIDMKISRTGPWEGSPLAGHVINTHMDLYAVAATFGVIKLLSDPPHWSDDGH